MPGTGSLEMPSREAQQPPKMIRLVETLKPRRYDIHLRVDPRKDDFSGRVKIEADLPRPAREIRLHAVGLSFGGIVVNDQSISPDQAAVDARAETVTIPLAREINGPVRLELEYSAPYDTQLKGLYLSTAKHDGRPERYAFTQFEATDFRRMVPSIDEPEAKAEFDLAVTAPKELAVVSNMKAASRSEDGASQTVRFGRTPKMSTYLLALGVARLQKKTGRAGKTEINVYTLPQDLDKAGFALKVATWSLGFLNRYFAIPYPLPKLDLVAVPDFASGAMENFGMMTFRDTAILLDPKRASVRDVTRVAEVVAHEIVHQWFGDLVTMRWWNDLWLNEAFATWLSYKVTDAWKKQWRVWEEFDEGKRAALRTDALDSTRSVAFDVSTPAQIREMFDVLTYQKGGSVLRMIETFLGEAVFRDGLRIYMRRHQYANATAEDLWSALEDAAREVVLRSRGARRDNAPGAAKKTRTPVGEIARSWLNQPGYPLVRAELTDDRKGVRLSQNRFFADGKTDSSSVWTVPVTVKYQCKGEKTIRYKKLALRERQAEETLSDRRPVEWLYPNAEEVGYYRSAFGPELLASLQGKAAVKLSPVERAGLLDHLWSQTRAGLIPTMEPFLNALSALEKEKSRAVLDGMDGYLRVIADRFLKEGDRPAFRAFAARMFSPAWKDLGWGKKAKESDERRLARATALDAMGYLAGSEKVLSEVERRLDQYLKDPKTLDPSLVSVTLNLGAHLRPVDAAAASKLFETYRRKLAESDIPQDKRRYYRALAEFSLPELVDQLLAMTLDKRDGEDVVRAQDMWYPFVDLLGNPPVQGRTWEFVKSRWGAIVGKLGEHLASRIIAATGSLWRKEWYEEAARFFKDADYAERTLAQAVEAARLGERFVESQSASVSAWLRSNSPEA